MKRLLLKSIVAGTALLASVSASAQTEKFYLGVTGYSGTEVDATKAVTVDATVYDDYSFVVSMPKKGQDLSANNATINVRMTDVASLNVSGTRSISKTITTGITNTTVNLENWLSESYDFGGVTCPVTVKDDGESKNFIYNIGAAKEQSDGTYTITGTPSNTDDARAAWQMITANVTASTSTTDDSYLTIPAGTYIQLGNEKLTFNKGYDYLKGTWTLDDQMTAVKGNASLETLSDVTGAESAKCIIYLPAGTTLALGTSYATLNKEATITLDASAVAGDETTYGGYLSELKEAANDDDAALYLTIAGAVKLFDQIVGLIDAADNVPITVQFGEETELTEKFYLGVTGYNDDVASTVDATVYDDYSFVVGLPVAGSKVDADKAKIDMRMTNVASLGVTGKRSISKTLETGINGVTAKLDSWLSYAYAFSGASLPVNVIDGSKEQSFTYNIGGATKQSDGTYTITGTPSSTSDARAAWQIITNNVTAGTQTDEDTYAAIKEGTYVQLGDERVIFVSDYDFLKGSWTYTTEVEKMKAAANVEDLGLTGSDTYKCVIYFPVGTLLSVGSSYAQLDKAATITIDGTSYNGEGITGILSDLAEKLKSSAAEGVATAMTLFNQVIGLVDAADGATITVEFENVIVNIYKTDGTVLENQILDDFITVQESDPNAVAKVVSGTVSENDETTNLIDNDVCANFVVTDKSPVNIPEAIGGFTATTASYSRTTSYTYGTICLPFAVSKDENIQYYQFSSLDSDAAVMTLTEATSVAANTPAVFAGTVAITAKNVEIPATEDGTFSGTLTLNGVQTETVTLAVGSSSYYIAQDKFWQPTSNAVTVYPQRAYFTGTSEVKAFTIALGDDATTAITALQDDDLTAANIYSISGVKQSSLQKGVNIIRYANGQTRKVIVK